MNTATQPIPDDPVPPAAARPDDTRDVALKSVPPRANENAESPSPAEAPVVAAPALATPIVAAPVVPKIEPVETNRRTVEVAERNRLSVDADGRLYWDGKPVQMHRRPLLSRTQVFGLTVLALLIAGAALGAAVQGSIAAHEFACKRDWVAKFCPPPPKPPVDIAT